MGERLTEARFWETEDDLVVRCTLCPHLCRVKDGKYGICGVRKNLNGKLFTLVYAQAAALHVDPIEKKPLFHFFPGSRSLSIATVGCNFSCRFCQNWSLSQSSRGKDRQISGQIVPPAQVVELAVEHDCRTIAFTYSEPTIFYEYAFDTAKLAAEKNIYGIFISNGYISPEPLAAIRPYLFGFNVDLKSFNPEYYRQVLGAKLEPVLESLRMIKQLGFWLEVTTLIVPTQNDSDEELTKIAEFICGLGPETPWHVSAFHPDYKMTNLPRTSVETLRRARRIGLDAGLHYVYTGNIPGDDGESTFCPKCGSRVIHRHGFAIMENRITDGHCPDCDRLIDGIALPAHEQELVRLT